MRNSISLFALFLSMAIFSPLLAQNEIDAVRFSQYGLGIGARALGMGGAYTGVANDYSAIFYNPAGLGQIKRMEFNLGFDFYQAQSDASYLNTSQIASNSRTAIQSLGFVMPFPTYQGSFVLAFGYNRQANFTTGQNINAFNPRESILNGVASSSRPVFDSNGNIILSDLASYMWEQYLLNDSNGAYTSLVNGNVLQNSELIEDGGKNNFAISTAFEVAPSVFIGGTLNIVSGSYSYARIFRETDSQNLYSQFQSLTLDESINANISGWNFKASMLYMIEDHFRLGLAVETPTTLTFNETSVATLSSNYKSSPVPSGSATSFSDRLPVNEFEYRLKTPYVFSGGISLDEPNFTISAQATFTDWTQMEYSADGESFADVNRVFRTDFQQTIDYAFGAELRSVFLPIRLRAGYNYQMSPLKFRDVERTQPTNQEDARKSISVGAGILLRKTLNIDVAYVRSFQSTFGRLYSGSSQISESLINNSIVLTTSFRF